MMEEGFSTRRQMDSSNKMFILVLLVICTSCVTGLNIPQPENLEVEVIDGEVTAVWNPPTDGQIKGRYNVQMGMYGSNWGDVISCTGITATYCDLTGLIDSYTSAYRVRVQLLSGDSMSEWTVSLRVYPNQSKLQPPSFIILATSSTLVIKVQTKPILRKLFPLGVTYTIFLDDRDQNNKTTTAILNSEMMEDVGTKTFDSLHWGTLYCVRLRVQGNGAVATSKDSSSQCLRLPDQEWYIIAVTSLSILGSIVVLAVLLTVICCFLKYPEKTPVSLKLKGGSWSPLTVAEGPMEVITDKGWFLTVSRAKVEEGIPKKVVTPQVPVPKERYWGTCIDSSETEKPQFDAKNTTNLSVQQDDSGCGSMGGSESPASTRSNTGEHLLQDRRTNNTERKDSGVDLGRQLDIRGILDGQENEILPEKRHIAGDDNQSQCSSTVDVHVCDEEDTLKQILVNPETVVSDFTGYKAGHQSCICFGAGRCFWCQTTGNYGTKECRENRNTCNTNALLNSKNVSKETYKEELSQSSYQRNTLMERFPTNRLGGLQTSHNLPCLELTETFPLLASLSSLAIVEEGMKCDINTIPLSLRDVELKND